MARIKPTTQQYHKNRLMERDIILFGAGGLGREVAAMAKNAGLNVVAFADETKSKQGTYIEGISIDLPKTLKEKYPEAIWLVTIFLPFHSFLKTKKKLESIGVEHVYSFYEVLRAFPENMPKHFFDHPENFDTESFTALYNELTDDESKKALVAFEKLVMRGNFDDLPYHEFLKESPFVFSADYTFIDAGAYNGDTLDAFIKHMGLNFAQYIALEPDSQNYLKLEEKAIEVFHKGSMVHALNDALWEKDGKIYFDAHGNTGSSINEQAISGNEATTRSLNSLFQEFQLDSKTCIKFDVEGVELKVIQAAESIIKAFKPQMMISIYHKPHDLTEIYKTIKKFRPDYRFALRCHGYDGTDTMLYCF